MKQVRLAGHRLPQAEAEVLEVLLAHGPMRVAEVRERLGSRRAHTTVATLLTRLVERGLVTREAVSRGHRYRAVGTEQELAALALERALEGVTDPAGALLAIIDQLPAPVRRRLSRRLSPGR